MRKDLVPFDRIIKALDWYGEHIGEPYIPVIQSGDSLRTKFTNLENAMSKQEKKPQGMYTTYSTTYGEDVPL